MKLFVINMAHQHEKKNRAIDILSNYKVDFTIIEAIDGSKLDITYLNSLDSTLIINFRGSKLSSAEVGVYLSHLHIYNLMQINNIEFACILEDDFVIKDGFEEIIAPGFISKIDSSFDIIMLGHFLSAKSVGVITKFYSLINTDYFSISEPLEFNYGAHAYIISKKAALTMLNKFGSPLCPIDNILGLSEIFGLKRLVVSPPVVLQSSEFESSIQTVRYPDVLSFKGKIIRLIKKIIFHISPKYQLYSLKKYRVL